MAKSSTPLLLGAGALAVAATRKKKKKRSKGHYGVRVSSDCKKVTFTNWELFQDFTLGAYAELMAADDSLSIVQVTEALFGEVAPQCAPFPEEPQSPAIAELYNVIIRLVTQHMAQDKRPQLAAFRDDPLAKEFLEWYRYWRNPPSPEIPQDFPDSEVAFSADLSAYEIGKNWYAKTVKPFVIAMVSAGNIPQGWGQPRIVGEIYDEFLANRAVVVGQFIMPIESLDKRAMVPDFLDKVRDAIERATSEVM